MCATATETETETTPDFTTAAHQLATLANPLRLRLLWEIRDEPLYLSQLAARLATYNAAASHHMKVLMLHGWVERDRRQKRNYYALTEAGRAALERAIAG